MQAMNDQWAVQRIGSKIARKRAVPPSSRRRCNLRLLRTLTLNDSQNIHGIANFAAQDLSYAKNVAIYQVLGVGLQVGRARPVPPSRVLPEDALWSH